MKPIDHVHKIHGKRHVGKCGTCKNMETATGRYLRRHVCQLYGDGEDWHPAWPACRLWNADITGYREVREIVRANRRSEPDGVVEGQIGLF